MPRYKRLLIALISRHTENLVALEEDRARAASLCAAGQLTASEYDEVMALLPSVE